MIKLLVVEDEATTRNGLLKHINWNEMGIDFIEAARNGVEGLDVASRFKPDIIISDIRMPNMNGINFSTHIRQQFPKCQIIFLSGYSDKEYLKAAINLGVVSYVEKPINLNEIKSVTRKAVELLLKKEKENQKREKINATFSNNVPYIKQNIVLKLISGNIDLKEILSELRLTGVSFKADSIYTVSIVSPSYSSDATDEVKLDICNDIIGCLEKQTDMFIHIAAVKDFNHIIIVSMHRQDIGTKYLHMVFKTLKNLIATTTPLFKDLSWIAGKSVTGLASTSLSYDTAQNSLGKIFFKGHGNISFYSDTADTSYNIDQTILSDFASLLERPSGDKINSFIDDFCCNVKKNLSTPINEIKNIFFQMAFTLLEESRKRGLQYISYEYLGEKHLWSVISKTETLEELRSHLLKNVDLYICGIKSIGTKCNAIVDVMDYIENNYSEINLTVKKLASYVYLTPTYLSSLFKKETGKTISEYITEVRISKSLEYLSDHRVKLYEIAKRTGYSDANYYSKAFKKIKGMTPSKFRKKYRS